MPDVLNAEYAARDARFYLLSYLIAEEKRLIPDKEADLSDARERLGIPRDFDSRSDAITAEELRSWRQATRGDEFDFVPTMLSGKPYRFLPSDPPRVRPCNDSPTRGQPATSATAYADFKHRTFVERVSLAGRETVYSAAFAFALDERSPLPLEQRLAVVQALSGVDTKGGLAIDVVTEWNNLDLLVTVHRDAGLLHIAVENKIKAVEGNRQLERYDRHIAELPGAVRKIFLTLAGDAPRSGTDWAPVPYSTLLSALRAQPASSNAYIADLCGALDRFVALSNAARASDLGLVAAAFDDEDARSEDDMSTYVSDMRLEKFVQRIWMNELASKLGVAAPWQTEVDESRGQAILNVQAVLDDLPGYLVGMQLQRRTLKAFCMPDPYPKSASAKQQRTVETTLERIRAALQLGADAKPSAPRSRGFRSFWIATLPPGRARDEWVAVLKPQVTKLTSVFR